MLVQYGSDYHLDANNAKLSDYVTPSANTFFLLGDLCNYNPDIFKESLFWLNDNFNCVYYVLGNHEFYGSSINQTYETIYKIKFDNNLHNIIFVDNEYFVNCRDDGELFNLYGGTLWVDTVKYSVNPVAILMADQKQIANFYEDVQKDRDNCLYDLKQNFNVEVLLTHYPPVVLDKFSEEYVFKYGKTPINDFFSNDLKLHDYIKYSFFGHVHLTLDFTVDNVRYLCNPRGVKGGFRSWNDDYDPCKTIFLEV